MISGASPFARVVANGRVFDSSRLWQNVGIKPQLVRRLLTCRPLPDDLTKLRVLSMQLMRFGRIQPRITGALDAVHFECPDTFPNLWLL